VFYPAFDSVRNRVADARRSGDLYFAPWISQETINSCFGNASAILSSGQKEKEHLCGILLSFQVRHELYLNYSEGRQSKVENIDIAQAFEHPQAGDQGYQHRSDSQYHQAIK